LRIFCKKFAIEDSLKKSNMNQHIDFGFLTRNKSTNCYTFHTKDIYEASHLTCQINFI
jgi:hypothetical protein